VCQKNKNKSIEKRARKTERRNNKTPTSKINKQTEIIKKEVRLFGLGT
jgi:hypothetical protein